MLALNERRQHPGDLRKRIGSHVRLERARKGGREGVDGKLRVRQVGLEVGEDVVAVVAVRVAVDLPAYAPGLELLRHGGPGEGAELRQTVGEQGLEQRPAVLAVRVE